MSPNPARGISIFSRPWPIGLGAIALAVVNLLMFVYARALGVFPQILSWGASFYTHLGIDTLGPFSAKPAPPVLLDANSMIDVGIIIGALTSALLAAEWKLRRVTWRESVFGLAGGALMGFGTVIISSCNMGGFWVATMALSLSGPLCAVGLLAGAYIGGKLLQFEKRRAAEAGSCTTSPFAASLCAITGAESLPRSVKWQRWAGLFLLLSILVAANFYRLSGLGKVGALFLFGAVFGLIMQRSRFCFVAAFRELTVARDGRVMKWTLLSVALSVIPFALLKAHGYQAMASVNRAGIHTVLGGLIFGVGMTIAGGCGMGSLARSGEGYVRSWLALVGGMVAASQWIRIYGGPVGSGWLYGKPVFLPNLLGWYGAVAFVFTLLALSYIAIRFVEKKNNDPVMER